MTKSAYWIQNAYQADSNYIYPVNENGKAFGEKRILTENGKKEIKRIEKETDYKSWERWGRMGMVYNFQTV